MAVNCPQCGAEMPADSHEGLCPKCLLEAGLDESERGPADSTEAATVDSKQPVDSTAPIPGTRVEYFGDYELLEEIARGGMGVVYKARQVSLNRIVALKMILAGQLAGEEDVKRFHAEAEAAAHLDHPGIVPVYEVGEHDGQHYFSMGFVEGGSLADKIKEGPLPPRDASMLVEKTTQAVAYAHERGVIHRDLKPGNILLDAIGEPKITDFGLAKRIEGDSGLTASGQILGTPSYMPPEQASGSVNNVGPLADVYSIGAILYYLLTGRPPFQAATVTDTLMQVLEKEPVAPRILISSIPIDLETICLKCLEKDTERRYESSQDLALDLQRFLNDEPIKARRVTRIERTRKWIKRNPRLSAAWGTACALVIIMAIGGPSMAIHQFRLAERSRAAEHRADQKAASAQRSERLAQRNLYGANIQQAQRSWNDGDANGFWRVLQSQVPTEPAGIDFRGIEWFLLANLGYGKHASVSIHTGQIRTLAYSHDGKYLAFGDKNGTITIKNINRNTDVTVPEAHSGQIYSIAFNADASRIATAGSDASRPRS